MLIVSQDKEKIVNFEQMASLYVDSWSNEEFATEPNCFCIKAEKASDNLISIFLGEYETEERAKEILEEILEKMQHKSFVEMSAEGVTTEISDGIYRMPKE